MSAQAKKVLAGVLGQKVADKLTKAIGPDGQNTEYAAVRAVVTWCKRAVDGMEAGMSRYYDMPGSEGCGVYFEKAEDGKVRAEILKGSETLYEIAPGKEGWQGCEDAVPMAILAEAGVKFAAGSKIEKSDKLALIGKAIDAALRVQKAEVPGNENKIEPDVDPEEKGEKDRKAAAKDPAVKDPGLSSSQLHAEQANWGEPGRDGKKKVAKEEKPAGKKPSLEEITSGKPANIKDYIKDSKHRIPGHDYGKQNVVGQKPHKINKEELGKAKAEEGFFEGRKRLIRAARHRSGGLQRGVHNGATGVHTRVAAGTMPWREDRPSVSPEHRAVARSSAKREHRQVLADLKTMPKPNLPKAEMSSQSPSDVKKSFEEGQRGVHPQMTNRQEDKNPHNPYRGKSPAGVVTRRSGGADRPGSLGNVAGAKDAHREVLAEMKAMPKPNLPKAEMPGGAAIPKQPAKPQMPKPPVPAGSSPVAAAAKQAQSSAAGKQQKPPKMPGMMSMKSEKTFPVTDAEIYRPCHHCGVPEFHKSESGPKFKPCACFKTETVSLTTGKPKKFVELVKAEDGKYKIKFAPDSDPEAQRIFLLLLKGSLLAQKVFGS